MFLCGRREKSGLYWVPVLMSKRDSLAKVFARPRQKGRSTMKEHRASSFGVCLGLTLMLGLSIVPALAVAADAPPIVGDWGGTLDPGAQPKKRILVHISAAQDGTLSGMIDYPDQDISGIRITAITYKEPTLHFESSSSLGSYDGTMNKDNSEITGTWKQGGATLSLVLKRTP
jgi:hypothetical protein